MSKAAAEFGAVALAAGIQSVVLLGLALAAVRRMKSQSAAMRHSVLFLAIASLPFLPLLSCVLPVWSVLPPWSAGVESHEAPARHMESLPREPADASSQPTVGPEAVETLTVSTASATPLPPPVAQIRQPEQSLADPNAILRWALGIWLTGGVATLLVPWLAIFSLRRLQKTSREVRAGELFRLLNECARALGLRRSPTLFVSDRRRMPMTWSVFHPKILVPAEAEEWPTERCRLVFLHELAHIQRRDYLSNLITQFVCALFWLNPLIWIAVRQLLLEREQACDDLVLHGGISATQYAQEVLDLSAGLPSSVLAIRGGIAMARRSSLEERLVAILDRTRNRSSLSTISRLATASLVSSLVVPVSMIGALDGARTPGQSDQPIRSGNPSAGSAEALPLDSLVAWWRADGSTLDTTGRHYGATPAGIRFQRGIAGNSFDFTRPSTATQPQQRITVQDHPDFAVTEELTLEAWVYPKEYGGMIIHRGDDRHGYDAWHLDLVQPGFVHFTIHSDTNQATGIRAPIYTDQWQHVAATFNRGEMRLYLNGVLMASKSTSLRPIKTLDPNLDPSVGLGNVSGRRINIPFKGFIDEVRIYRRALLAEEVAARVSQ